MQALKAMEDAAGAGAAVFGLLTPYRRSNPATIVPVIRDLALSGSNYERIGAALNTAGVPTARGTRWSGATVLKVMRRFGVTLNRSSSAYIDPCSLAALLRGRATLKARRDARDAKILPCLASIGCYALAWRLPFNPLEVIWDWRQQFYLAAMYLLLALPFFATGSAIGLSLAARPAHINAIYRSDLTGAGTGALGIVLAMFALPPEDCLRVVAAC